MKHLRRFFLRLRNTFAGGPLEDRLRDEVEEHIASQADENVRAGMPPAEARRQAVLKFGPVEAIKEDHRTEQTLVFLQTLFRDLRDGVRNLWNAPGFTLVAILTLALGIGANTVIFSAINGILFEHLPYANASQLLVIDREQIAWGITPEEASIIKEQSPAFEQFAFSDGIYYRVTIGDALPKHRDCAIVSGEYFPLLGVSPLLGRYLVASDVLPGAAPVAVLSYQFWMDGFGGDEHVLGREVTVDQSRYRVVGVMPDRFDMDVYSGGRYPAGMWLPLVAPRPTQRISRLIGRVKPDVPVETAKAQIAAVSPRVADRFRPGTEHIALEAKAPGVQVYPTTRSALMILQGAVVFVLLLACVNVSALLVARSWWRQREIAIRKALGAGRLRIVRQLLTESLVLAVAGGGLGLLLAVGGIRVFRAIAPPDTPRLERMILDSNVLWFTFAVSFLSAVLFGLAPALQASRRHFGGADAGLGANLVRRGARRSRFSRSSLLIVEVALAVVLVVGGALMARSFQNLMNVDPGVRQPGQVLTMSVELSDTPCADGCEATTAAILDDIEALPGVERAAIFYGPVVGGSTAWRAVMQLDDSDIEQPYEGTDSDVSPGFFESTGVTLLRGRLLEETDTAEPVVVNQKFADLYLGGNPLGRRFSEGWDGDDKRVRHEVVGLVNNTRDLNMENYRSGAVFYTRMSVAGGTWQLAVRTRPAPVSMTPAIEGVIRSVDKAAIVTEVQTLEQFLYDSASMTRFETTLLGLFGLLALLLAVIGVYGVTSYSVLQRTHEIGVRMALGARASDVIRHIVGEGGVLALCGVALGVGGALVMAGYLRDMLYEIRPLDVTTFAAVAALLLAATLAACYLPARAATRVDPITTLRQE